METVGQRLKAARPDTIIVVTPHGLRLGKHIGIYTSEYCTGSLADNGVTVHAEFACDRELAMALVREGETVELPVVGCNYGALEGPASDVAMDWGTLIPLWFCGARDEVRPKLVVVTPTREIRLERTVLLGKVIARVAAESGKRVALVASADQGHAHLAQGPYGYDPAAAEYDKEIVRIVKEDRPADLLKISPDLVDRAKPDSLWQMLVLYGASQITPLRREFLSYQVPTYFGMMVASYTPK
jgi:aromatic ring-opening dioxygenase LigB subunit